MAKAKAKAKIHIRDHDGATVRVWTDEMASYGQFNIESLQGMEITKGVLDSLSEHDIIVHHCDGYGDCNCAVLSPIETIKQNL